MQLRDWFPPLIFKIPRILNSGGNTDYLMLGVIIEAEKEGNGEKRNGGKICAPPMSPGDARRVRGTHSLVPSPQRAEPHVRQTPFTGFLVSQLIMTIAKTNRRCDNCNVGLFSSLNFARASFHFLSVTILEKRAVSLKSRKKTFLFAFFRRLRSKVIQSNRHKKCSSRPCWTSESSGRTDVISRSKKSEVRRW